MMEQKNNNIILVGMPGVGKSTVGVVLAKILGYHFVDADIVIQQKDGRLLKDIIAEEGVDGFIEIENKINSEINGKKTIIATGGDVIYLKLDYDTLINRLGDIKNRGVVLKDGQTLKDLYDERCKLYEKYADIVVDEAGLDVEKTIDKLVENLQK